jgi:membrane-associated phospholipid phosphatase/4-amino-4-deoxy-L-arabinose transferase-like glycosyltransferase
MHWLQSLDSELFRFINLTLVNPVLDVGMPLASHNAFFGPLVLLAVVLLVWKGRARGALCVLMLALIIPLGDGMICNKLKHAIGRPRPFAVMPDIHRPGSSAISDNMAPAPSPQAVQATPPSYPPGSLTSMPSSHAANWFAATMILFIYYRRSVWFMLPAALVVSFSRIYNGVHYPSDVLVGAILGAGYAAAGVWSLNAFWQWAGQKWFPLWWTTLPSLLAPSLRSESTEDEEMPPSGSTPHATVDQHWLRLGYIWVAAGLLARLAYIASGTIQLGEDEAYQWLWSKHLALSYYSKPPLIAYTQFLGTSLWGDTAFGIRFFSPVIAAILGLLLLRFFAREVNARAGFFLLLIITATPLMSAGAVLMTIDPLSVLFWTAAMLAGWRAVQPDAPTRQWLWVGLWMGLGFLSKYTELFQLLSWAVFFILWPPARKHLRRPGPYLALLAHMVCTLPVLIWNAQHGWITVSHVAQDAGVGSVWKPSLKYLGEFLGGEAGLLNPIFFGATVWAAIAFWRRGRHNPRLVYFFSMGAPVFLAYLAQTLRSRVQLNWIAPSVLPMFCLMVIYWDTKWRLGATKLKPWLVAGLTLGFVLVVLGHDTNLLTKATGLRLPVNQDPLHRVREWSEVARVAGEARRDLLAEGKPTFIIAAGYGLTGEISFYLPEAKATVTKEPLVFCQTSGPPSNQFYYWPSYKDRRGQNAVFVRELDRDRTFDPEAPPELEREFESVTLLGVRDVLYHGRVLRPLQFYACRGLR